MSSIRSTSSIRSSLSSWVRVDFRTSYTMYTLVRTDLNLALNQTAIQHRNNIRKNISIGSVKSSLIYLNNAVFVIINLKESMVSHIKLHVCRISLKPLLVHYQESHTIKQVKCPLIFWKHMRIDHEKLYWTIYRCHEIICQAVFRYHLERHSLRPKPSLKLLSWSWSSNTELFKRLNGCQEVVSGSYLTTFVRKLFWQKSWVLLQTKKLLRVSEFFY